MKRIILLTGIIFLTISCTKEVKEITRPQEFSDAIFQYSTKIDLNNGVFDGDLTQQELKTFGDFGIGTFNGVDGEMVVYNSIPYRVSFEGPVGVPPENYLIPFAAVKFFTADTTFILDAEIEDDSVKSDLLSFLIPIDKPAAIKISGDFEFVQTRSVPKQTPPYTSINDVITQQNIFNLGTTGGTVIGFWLPEKFDNMNFPGFHLHFLNDSFTAGGHALDFTTRNVVVEIDYADEILVRLIH